MSSVSESTQEQQNKGNPAQRPRRPYWWPKSRYIPALGPNELASTDRDWAIKPPPGMESDPFTPENIERELGEFLGGEFGP